jgi:predicted dehydrogenase
LIAGEYPVDDATAAFDSLKAAGDRPLTLVLAYPQEDVPPVRTVTLSAPARAKSGALGVAVLGAGSFVQGMHLPNMVKLGDHFHLRGVMSRTGANARAVATQYQAAYATTEVEEVLADAAVDVVIIATRHDLHAGLALQALKAGKHVLLEKPLALSEAGLQAIEAFYRAHPDGPILMTGFNRRFAPGVAAIRTALETRDSPLIATYRMNAGHIAAGHWVHGPEGGGRNIGEACHIYDLFLSLARADVVDVRADAIAKATGHFGAQDNFSASITFADGSLANLVYTALGAKAYPKERMELFSDAMVFELDDYRATRAFGTKRGVWTASATDKGHFAMLEAFGKGVKAGEWPISLADQLAASRIALAVEAAINPGASWVDRLIARETQGDA